MNLPATQITGLNMPQKRIRCVVIHLMVAEKKNSWTLQGAVHYRVHTPTGQVLIPCLLSSHLYPSYLHPSSNIVLLVSERMTKTFYRKVLNAATVRKNVRVWTWMGIEAVYKGHGDTEKEKLRIHWRPLKPHCWDHPKYNQLFQCKGTK